MPKITCDVGEALPIEMDDLTDTLVEPILGRVPAHIRANHEKEYEPHIITIGPYHRNIEGQEMEINSRLKPMEDRKQQFFSDLRKRVASNRSMSEEDVSRNITTVVQKRRVEAEGKYSQTLFEKMCSEDFLQMLVLDGCFIVELLLKQNQQLSQGLPKTFQADILISIKHDLLLYENQIPFFIIEEIHGTCFPTTTIDMSNSQSIRSLAIKFFGYENEFRDQKIHHLLHLYHMNVVSVQNPRADSDRGNDPKNCTTIFYNFIKTIFNSVVVFMIFILLSPALLLFGLLLLIWSWWNYCWNTKKYVAPMETTTILRATQLSEYGVQFRGKQTVSRRISTDVSFEDGIMEIPTIYIQDYTSTIYHNLLALEQSSMLCSDMGVYGNKFTSYVVFMDYLIDTTNDVALLRKSKILNNNLGSEEEVAKLFNEMCVGLGIDTEHHYLVDMYEKINKYCDGTYNKWRATLMRDYLNSPWSIISVLAVSFVICLTIVQTVCSIIQVKTGK